MANTSLGDKHVWVERLKNHDPDSDLMETNLSTSLTFQGDFCDTQKERAALRCEKRGQEVCCTSSSKEDLCRAAARKMNLGRRKMSTLQQRIPRMKEHTSTVDMELPKVE